MLQILASIQKHVHIWNDYFYNYFNVNDINETKYGLNLSPSVTPYLGSSKIIYNMHFWDNHVKFDQQKKIPG